jgi:hypothetical protein
MEAVRTSESAVYFYGSTWRCVPEGCHTDADIGLCSHMDKRFLGLKRCLFKMCDVYNMDNHLRS